MPHPPRFAVKMNIRPTEQQVHRAADQYRGVYGWMASSPGRDGIWHVDPPLIMEW